MTRKPIPLSQAAVIAKLFRQYVRLIQLEFAGRTAEEQYELAFSRLTKPNIAYALGDTDVANDQPDDGSFAPFMLGTDQRDLFLPRVFEFLPPQQERTKIFDLGCGDGQTSQYVLERIRGAIDLRILDSNPNRIEQYKETLQGLGRDIVVSAQCDDVDSALSDLSIFGENGDCDMIFAIHMAYFSDRIESFTNFFIERLRTKGRMFLAFADEMRGFTGQIYRRFLEESSTHGDDPYWQNILRLHELFGLVDGAASRRTSQLALSRRLGRNDFNVVEAIRQPSRIYGNDPGDIIASAFVTNLLNAPGAAAGEKVEFVSRYVGANPDELDLAIETAGCRKGMISVAQPQFLIVIEKK